MAADLGKLTPELGDKVSELLDRCRARGIEMRPNAGLRDPFEQARLWRQSRAGEEIKTTIAKLKSAGAPFLAHCIEGVGPQHGSHATDTPPGLSWHQWGEALDCFWVLGGKAEWSTSKKNAAQLNGYSVYAEEAEAIGLTAGGHWPRFKDWAHVQLRNESNAGVKMTLPQIDAEMRARFG